jgi:putative phage-type endonuclease
MTPVLTGTAPAFDRVDVVSDTAPWEAERRHSLGASEIPAILGLSPWATPLDIYRSKFGIDRDMDPELAFIGHAEELTIGRWLRKFRPELGQIRRGFMARSIQYPWLHASFDRFLVKRGVWTPVQMKTAHQYAGDDWEDDQVPLAVQAQVQAELLVHGSPYGYAVAFVGGRRFHLVQIVRDEEFLQDILIPQASRFWHEHVLAENPPDPTSSKEAVSLWPGIDDDYVADGEVVRMIDLLRVEQAAVKSFEAEVDRLKLEIQKQMRNATQVVDPMGEVLATWKPTAGARRFDSKALAADHPALASEYTVRGNPGRSFRLKPLKEQTP